MFNSTQNPQENVSSSPEMNTLATIDSNIRFPIAVIFSAIAIFTVTANSVIIVALIISLIHDKRRNNDSNAGITKILMGSMAVSDVMLGALVMPLDIHDLITNDRKLLGQDLNLTTFYFDMFLSGVSVYHVVFMAVERYLAVCKPFFRRTMTIKTGYLMIGLSWIVPPAISAVSLFTGTRQAGSGLNGGCSQRINDLIIVFNSPVAIICTTLSFNIPFILMLILYCRILWNVWKFQKRRSRRLIMQNQQGRNAECSVKNTSNCGEENKVSVTEESGSRPTSTALTTPFSESQSQSGTTVPGILHIQQCRNLWTPSSVCVTTATSENSRPTSGDNNLKAVKTIGSIVICFAVCWLPFITFSFITLYYCTTPNVWTVLVVQWLSLINSAINPILYCQSASIRRAIAQLFCSLN